MNKSKTKKQSQFKGVTWSTKFQKWVAQFYMKGKSKQWLGSFDTERQAAIAYDKKAISLGIRTGLNVLKPVVSLEQFNK